MANVIAPFGTFFNPPSTLKLQDALKKAEDAISLLDGNVDQEAAAILKARYEELKERHEYLTKTQSLDSAGLSSTTSSTEGASKDAPSPLGVTMEQQSNGKIKCTLWLIPGDPSGGTRVFEFKPSEDQQDQMEQALEVTQEFINLAMASIADYAESLEDHQINYLSDSYDRLVDDRQKIGKMKSEGSSTSAALEISVQLYLSDVLRFCRAVFLVIRAKGGEVQ